MNKFREKKFEEPHPNICIGNSSAGVPGSKELSGNAGIKLIILKKILTIFCIACMLSVVQNMHGQQEISSAADPPQVRIRIPFQAANADGTVQATNTDGSIQATNTDGSIHGTTAAPSDQARKSSASNQEMNVQTSSRSEVRDTYLELFRENIRGDSLDLFIEQAALAQYKAKYPGLRVLSAVPVLDLSDMATTMAEALTFQKYPTYAQYDSMMHYFADTYPSICRVDTFGTSNQGRLLLALKISDHVALEEDEPAFLYTSTMHGDELVGYVLCLRLADFLLSNYGTNVEVDRIINDVELWINPLSNPDGTFYPDNNKTVQASIRTNVNDAYDDKVGMDLNRDFPDPGKGEADDPVGREKETGHMMAFMQQIRPNLSANIHSGAEVVNYPWDHKTARHPDNDWYILISQEYADEAKAVNSNYLNLYASGITNGADWYIINGGRQDYVNYYLHGREVTLELSYAYRLESEYLENHWNYNKWSLINLVTQSRYGIHGNITDESGNPLRALVRVVDHDNDSSLVESDPETGNFYRYLKEGVYNLRISSEGYLTNTVFGVEVFDYQQTPLSVQLSRENTSARSRNRANFLRVYRNPARDLLRLSTTATFTTETTITITDLSGRTLISATPPAGTSSFAVDVSALTPGIYVLRRSGDSHPGSVIISTR